MDVNPLFDYFNGRPGRLMRKSMALPVHRTRTGLCLGKNISVSAFARSTRSMTYCDSMLVFEKRKIEQPVDRKSGQPSF